MTETDTDTITGNAIRTAMLFEAIRACSSAGEPLTVELVGKYLPGRDAPGGYFDLLDTELQAAVAAISRAPNTAVLEEPIADAETLAAVAAPVADAPGMSREEAAERVRLAHQDLANFRAELIAAGDRQRKARASLASAVTAFIAGQAPVSREQLVRDTIKADLAYRQAVKDGTIPPRQRPRPGRSAVDVTAYYSRGGSPAGGGNSFRRGGMTLATAARMGFQKPMPAPAPAPAEKAS